MLIVGAVAIWLAAAGTLLALQRLRRAPRCARCEATLDDATPVPDGAPYPLVRCGACGQLTGPGTASTCQICSNQTLSVRVVGSEEAPMLQASCHLCGHEARIDLHPDRPMKGRIIPFPGPGRRARGQ